MLRFCILSHGNVDESPYTLIIMKNIKRVILFAFFCGAMTVSLSAQSGDSVLLSKKGRPVLPASGQIALGLDATPFFEYLGNLMNRDVYNTLYLNLVNNQVYGKYLLTDKHAFRLKLGVSNNSTNRSNLVTDDLDPTREVEDKVKARSRLIRIAPGFEMRYGKSRLQLIYGGEISFVYAEANSTYEYGNLFSADNPSPTSTLNFSTGATGPTVSRLMESDSGTEFGFGIRAFTGMEYFFLPRLSIGAEIGIGYDYNKSSKRVQTTEYWDFVEGGVETLEDVLAGDVSTSFGTDILNGRFALLFYF